MEQRAVVTSHMHIDGWCARGPKSVRELSWVHWVRGFSWVLAHVQNLESWLQEIRIEEQSIFSLVVSRK